MMRRKTGSWFALAALLAVAAAGCITEPSHRDDGDKAGPPAAVDRKFTVTGPVRLELTNGSGDSHVEAGAAGQVLVHAEFREKSRLFQNGHHRLDEMAANPPISQEGNLIRIGASFEHFAGVEVNYTLTVPPDTQIHAMSGSGTIEVSGIKGPASFTTGSGTISATNIAGDVQATAGSGDVRLSSIQGQVQITAGSGDIQLAGIRGDVRAQTGSGDIKIANSQGSLEAGSGSGSITLGQVSSDLRARTSSGEIAVEGNPPSNTYWEMHTSSGNVTLHVPASADFRLYARTSSGDIDTQIPIIMEGTAAKHELRARIGDGKARVEIETSSGKILLR